VNACHSKALNMVKVGEYDPFVDGPKDLAFGIPARRAYETGTCIC